jgi:hypothetical protein
MCESSTSDMTTCVLVSRPVHDAVHVIELKQDEIWRTSKVARKHLAFGIVRWNYYSPQYHLPPLP